MENQINNIINEEELYNIASFYNPNDEETLQTVSMTELYDQSFQKRPPIIDGLILPGTYIFAGAPKLGKSFLMMQIAYHVATGTDMWGYHVHKGTVLYLALEDDLRRLQERLFRMFGTECTDDLYLATRSDTLEGNLINQMEAFREDHPDTSLIIIDTLQKVKEQGNDKYSYANDYETIGKLKAFTDFTGISLLIVHHTRKQQSDDHFEMISGTTAIHGAADGAFILHKDKRVGSEAILEISGRDQMDQKLYLNRNAETLIWEITKAEAEEITPPADPILEKVAAFANKFFCWEGSPSEFVKLLGLDMAPNKLTMYLNVNLGRLAQEYNVEYKSMRTHDGRRIRVLYDPWKA